MKIDKMTLLFCLFRAAALALLALGLLLVYAAFIDDCGCMFMGALAWASMFFGCAFFAELLARRWERGIKLETEIS